MLVSLALDGDGLQKLPASQAPHRMPRQITPARHSNKEKNKRGANFQLADQ